MALKPKNTLTSLSETGNSFVLTDTTGAYNATTNPGGYGAPNITTSDVQNVLIELYLEGSKNERLSFFASGVSGLITGTPLTISVGSFGETGYFKNGVIHIIYSVLTQIVGLSSVGADLKSVNSSAQFRGNESVIVVGTKSYRVDTNAANTPSTLKLLDAVPSETLSVLPGYFVDTTIFNTKQLESNIAKEIGEYAGKCDCSCKDKERDHLVDILLRQIGSGVRYACGDLQGAQQIVTAAEKDLKGGCKC